MQTELDKREEYIPQQPTCCGKKKRRGDEGRREKGGAVPRGSL